MTNAWIVDPRRSAFTRAGKGAFAQTRPDDLLAALFVELLAAHPGAAEALDDVVVGCAYPEAEQGRNPARAIALLAGIPDRVPAMTLTRMCASSLEATAVAAAKVKLGEASLALVGGVESMTLVPMGGVKPSPNPRFAKERPEALFTMGQTAERVAERYGVSRADQDAWALRSHQRAVAARTRGVFSEEIVALTAAGGEVVAGDDGLRPDTSAEKLATLKPVFSETGSVTAGNASPINDGASALLVASDGAVSKLGLHPLGRVVSYAVGGVAPDVMGIGPVVAVPLALQRAGLELPAVDRIELNEAFASQVIAVVRQLGLLEERTNVNGGAIALGHPLGATGARLVGTLLRELERSGGRLGLATLCIGGGMGAAMVVER
jgi:acetyl-CoA acyltransferase